jgi:HD-GYP domain-containing protein (c-di-GMP phosphodiesterase class II)
MEQVSLAELCSAISLFTDLGTGQPAEHAMRTTLTAMRLADVVGIEPEARPELYYTSLLRFFGCTADAAATASAVGGDEGAFYGAMAPVSMGSSRDQLRTMTKVVAPDASRPARARRLLAMLTDRKGAERTLLPHCEVGARLANRMDLPQGVAGALSAAYARWDGNGVPAGLAGEDIPMSMRIAIVARDIVLWADRNAEVADVLADRRGRALDPTVVDAALGDLGALMVSATGDLWDETMEAEPSPHRMLAGATLDDAFAALADFADLKIPETVGHSRGVANLVAHAAQLSGAGHEDIEQVRRAALAHDLGRVGVANTIWSHPGQLSATQWEKVRLHPYYSERILARTTGLGTIARLAGCDHERADGSGYHRGSTGDLGAMASLLAVADACQAMGQPRPHRDPLSSGAMAAALRVEVDTGRLARNAVEAVLAAAAGATAPVETRRPADLTEREVDVLRLIARGLTNKQAAGDLGISPKTVGTHIEHIYAKAGVTTRAAATLFAIEQDLLD